MRRPDPSPIVRSQYSISMATKQKASPCWYSGCVTAYQAIGVAQTAAIDPMRAAARPAWRSTRR